jgi:hypothetical protein
VRGTTRAERNQLGTVTGDFGELDRCEHEADSVRVLSKALITAAEGPTPPASLRGVHSEEVTVDGQHLPVLTEMPMGHMRCVADRE